MSNANLCDICKKAIVTQAGIFNNHGLYSQYLVKVKKIEEGFSLAGAFRKTQTLDVCPSCMNKFVEFATKEAEMEKEK